MDKRKKRLFIRSAVLIVIAIALVYLLYYSSSDNHTTVRIGDEAPNFVLRDLDGNEVELAEYRGQGVFLNFWGTYCPPCEKEMPYMENQYAIYRDKGVEILAVNVGEPELTVSRFVQRHDLSFPILMDNDRQVLDRYGVIPLPTTFLVNPDGIVTDIITGGMTESNIAEYMESIKP